MTGDFKDPAKLADWLRGQNLSSIPKQRVFEMFKAVDFNLDMIATGGTVDDHKAWMEPWDILMDFIDPKRAIEIPIEDWAIVADYLGMSKDSEPAPELF